MVRKKMLRGAIDRARDNFLALREEYAITLTLFPKCSIITAFRK